MTATSTLKPRLYAFLAIALVTAFGMLALAVRTPAVDTALTTPWVLGVCIGVAFVLAVSVSYRARPKVAVVLVAARVLAGAAGLLVGVFMTLVLVLADSTDKSVLPLVLTFAGVLSWALTSVMKLQLKLEPH
jgi:hypothetical protein